MKKNFSLGAALSVSTGKGCAELAEIQALAEHILDRPILTHELGEALPVARLLLLGQFPRLDAITMPNGLRTKETVARWLGLLADAGLPPSLGIDN